MSSAMQYSSTKNRNSTLPYTMVLPRISSCLCSSFLFYLTLFSSIHLFIFWLPVQSATLGNATDLLALVAFKNQITTDPKGALVSWNDSLHFCQWKGVTCSRRHPERVTVLSLPDQGLVGPTSTHIANLSFLRKIHLGNNSFYGQVPGGIYSLPRLQRLNLSWNSYQGEIPANLTTQLRTIHLQMNELVGFIPDELHSLSSLTRLNLDGNRFSGIIPPSLGNLSSLTHLFLGHNTLHGSIPYSLGRLVRLNSLNLESNTLSGTIPSPLYNLSSIVIFAVDVNQLHGYLPSDLGLTLPNLEGLYVGLNRFTGNIPISLPNASRLAELNFDENHFGGPLPMNFGNLQGLKRLGLGGNLLGGWSEANDLTFLNSLTNCSSLETLYVDHNNFKGVLPNAMANLSIQLTYLFLEGNQISGEIPLGIENLVGLSELDMQENSMTGTIPVGIGKLKKLGSLVLSGNSFSGDIPTSLGNLTQLIIVSLSHNNLTGNIPLSLENCSNIQELHLDYNQLSGSIPRQILNFPSLSKVLDLSHNSLTGNLPSEIGNLKALRSLYISYNNLYGKIPSSFGSCISLEYQYLEEFHGLEYLNLSFNDLEGEVPKEGIFRNVSATSLEGNSNICGGVLELHIPPCPGQAHEKHRRDFSLKVIISMVSLVSCLLLTTLSIVALYWRRKSRKKTPPASFLDDQLLKVSYAELRRATNGFSLENLIGAGSYGSVYKGTLEINEKIVAVKVLNLQQHGASKSFNDECEVLRNTRHRSLVKILTSCSSIDFNGNEFKALIFEYMPKGSLEKWLHHNEGEQHLTEKLTFVERVNVAIDVAFALDYLHYHGPVPIVHRDLKPSNILFDDDMNAHVGDFGLAKLLFEATDNCSDDKTSSSIIKGSIGYIAPEYGMGCKASTKGDVYSYGILLLEIFTGKRPTDAMFQDRLNLYQFTKMFLPDQVMEIADPQLLLDVEDSSSNTNNQRSIKMRDKMQNCLIEVFKVGISCCVESPNERMEMRDVIPKMIAIKELYLGTR